ncbi:MAG: L-threonine 3-dehydrogenase [Defluviitaleaceae bacterium]|nr:L-threonine 3-dehydrogenase [Defluviitaleaceae bacterium]MCL2835772.1 L-threonine 3-dehydrogenase [Defluviitaleaceae bacterium]
MKTMKALVKKHPEQGLWLDQVPIPEPGPNDVLIKIRKTAICGTDVHIYEWDEWAKRTIPVPMTVGHEFVGEVAGFGSNVKSVKLGQIVSGEGHLVCGVCRNCLAGRRHLCPKTKGVGVNRDGCFAEYLCIPECNVWICDPSIPEELYSFFDPFGNAVHTALQFDLLGEDVLVTGAGPIGIMAAAVCRHAGARNVVILNRGQYRRDLAHKMGLEHAYSPAEISTKEIMEKLGMKEGFDVGLEMSGSAVAFNNMVDHMAHGGKIAMLGMQAKGTAINWDKVVFNMLTLKGIYGREMYETWYKMTMLLQTGLDISPIVTHRYHIDDFEKGFDAMRSGNSGKVVLSWE